MRSEADNNFDREDDAVSHLVGGLPRIEAPANFERRVMTKIAEGDTTPRRFFGLPLALAYTLPLLLVLAGGTAVFIGMQNRSQAPNVSEVAANKRFDADPSGPTSSPIERPQGSPEIVATAASDSEHAKHALVSPVNRDAEKKTRGGNSNQHGGGSYDKADPQKKSLFPSGISPMSKAVGNSSDVSPAMNVSVTDALTQIGITADYEGGWKVRSVGENSLAGHSGVKAGDIVTALGKTELGSDTVFKNTTEASSISVRRDGSVLTLPIKP